MEQLQEGYVAAVAATAGCLLEIPKNDKFGLDTLFVRLPSSGATEESSLYAQLKSTTKIRPDPTRAYFTYQFSQRRYLEVLAAPRKNIKAILIVMLTHPVQSRWSLSRHQKLELRHCCYWVSLEGHTIADGVQYPSVRVPTANVFDAVALTTILDVIERGGDLRDPRGATALVAGGD